MLHLTSTSINLVVTKLISCKLTFDDGIAIYSCDRYRLELFFQLYLHASQVHSSTNTLALSPHQSCVIVPVMPLQDYRKLVHAQAPNHGKSMHGHE